VNPVTKVLIILGVTLVAAGLLWQLFGKYLPLGRLPGDVVVEKERFRFYFPIVTCILISILLSLLFWVVRLIWK
jgi:hypothetical protein